MSPKAIGAILEALTGATCAEWSMIREYIDREFAAAARRVQLLPEDAEAIARKLANEQGMGEAKPRQENRQTRMF